MTPAFFQNLHPFLPFAYGVGAMRECVAGVYGHVYEKDILILLLCYVPILKASLSVDNLREETAAKAQAFEGNYKKMVRFGFLAIIIIPLIFLVLMFSLESKIVFLVLWILSIIIIAVWLIVVEFIHNNLQEQQKIAGMSFDEMLEKFRGKEKE